MWVGLAHLCRKIVIFGGRESCKSLRKKELKNLWNFVIQQDSTIVIVNKYAGMRRCNNLTQEDKTYCELRMQNLELGNCGLQMVWKENSKCEIGRKCT